MCTPVGINVHSLAKELTTAGYYKYKEALKTVFYWLEQGKTLNDIRTDYHLGGDA